MAVARDLKGEDRNVIAVIGDGAMSAGMAYEAMNNAGASRASMIVVLNDNDMSIAPPVGAMSAYLSRLISSRPFLSLRELMAKLARRFPRPLEQVARRADEFTRGLLTGGTLFEELGFYYVGPIDGHDLDHLMPVLRNLRDTDHQGPILLHVVTQKGKGYAPAESDRRQVSRRRQVRRRHRRAGQGQARVRPAYTTVFAEALVAEARARRARSSRITAAMPSGTGLDIFAKVFPDRTFDVGIAEQHAVTFAAGMATEGMKPFCAIYSTFLQRAYDQVVHDVALQSLPVRFALDRAGLVGADGATHAGAFDIAYLGCLPNMVLMAAADEQELMHMVATAAAIDDRPSAFRYPRGEGRGLALPARGTPLEIGRGRVLRQGLGTAILSYGARLGECLAAAEELAARGILCTVADARFAKPLDRALIRRLARNHEALITVEEGSVGGFGSFVLHALADDGLFEAGLKIKTLTLPDRFQDQDTQARMYAAAGLDAAAIVAVATGLCRPSQAAWRAAQAGSAALRLVPAHPPAAGPLHEAST